MSTTPMRTLVPFFVPGEGETVNESLSAFPQQQKEQQKDSEESGNGNGLGGVVGIRQWDKKEGYFRDAEGGGSEQTTNTKQYRKYSNSNRQQRVYRNTSANGNRLRHNSNLSKDKDNGGLTPTGTPPPPPPPPPTGQKNNKRNSNKQSKQNRSGTKQSPTKFNNNSNEESSNKSNTPVSNKHKLLTPAEIRRRKSQPIQSSASSVQTPTPQKQSSTPQQQISTPNANASAQAYAGSSFEVASPPPTFIPIPAFKKSASTPSPSPSPSQPPVNRRLLPDPSTPPKPFSPPDMVVRT